MPRSKFFKPKDPQDGSGHFRDHLTGLLEFINTGKKHDGYAIYQIVVNGQWLLDVVGYDRAKRVIRALLDAPDVFPRSVLDAYDRAARAGA